MNWNFVHTQTIEFMQWLVNPNHWASLNMLLSLYICDDEVLAFKLQRLHSSEPIKTLISFSGENSHDTNSCGFFLQFKQVVKLETNLRLLAIISLPPCESRALLVLYESCICSASRNKFAFNGYKRTEFFMRSGKFSKRISTGAHLKPIYAEFPCVAMAIENLRLWILFAGIIMDLKVIRHCKR